jgi:nicotinate phosphoribosyltransferase
VPRIKLSEQSIKVSTPGLQQVRRFYQDGRFLADAIYDPASGCPAACTIVNIADPLQRKAIPLGTVSEDLLIPILRGGQSVGARPDLETIRNRALSQRAALDPTIKRLSHPHAYPAGLELSLHERKLAMIQQTSRPTP